MAKLQFNRGYWQAMKDAALIAERTRDALNQLRKYHKASGAESLRKMYQRLIDECRMYGK